MEQQPPPQSLRDKLTAKHPSVREGPDGIRRPVTVEMRLNSAFARQFSGAEGEMLLNYLEQITLKTVRGPKGLEPYELAHAEGMRFLYTVIQQRKALGELGE
jgi:hypothetical protein